MATIGSKHARKFVAQCYEQFGERLNRYLSRQLRRSCGNPQDVRDLAQEVWCRLLRIKDTTEVLEPMAYIHTSALNVLREHYLLGRRQSASLAGVDRAQDAVDELDCTAADAAEELALEAELDRTIALLPKMQREVLFLKTIDGYDWSEIGKKLNLTENTAYMYFWRAMTALKKSREER